MVKMWSCRPLAAALIALVGWSAQAVPDDALAPGLLAKFSDGERTVGQRVVLPELGLAPDESPSPAIKPAFSASYEGFLTVTQPGRYRFSTDGELSIGGEPVEGEVALDAGRHALLLRYQRPAGPVRFGLSWMSEHFIQEPVPPSALWHEKASLRQQPEGPYSSPPHRIAQAIETMKCATCHDPAFLATMHHRFAPGALLTHMRHANPMKWYGAMTGPLLEESELISQLAEDLGKLPQPGRKRGEPSADTSKGLEMVGAQKGLACVACHDLKHHRTAAESKGPNLSYLANRVSYDWFVRWMSNPQRLKPGVAMPVFFAGQPPEQQMENINALWDYLLLGEEMPVPPELVPDPQQFVLKPTTAPMVNRVNLRLPDGRELVRAICVGLPNGVSYCFDAESCRLVFAWTGGYLDMTDHWKNQSLHPVAVVGEELMLLSAEDGLRIGNERAEFRGYELVDGLPRFEFAFGDTLVRLVIDVPSTGEIRQTFTVAARSGPVTFVGPASGSAVVAEASRGKWDGNLLTASDKERVELVVKLKKKQ